MEKAGGSGSGGGGAGGVAAASSASCNSNSSAGQSQFGAFFGPPTPSNSQLLLLLQGRGKQTAGNHPPNPTLATPKDYKVAQMEERKNSNNFNNYGDGNGKTIEPCYFNSSIYYGAQEVYFPTNHPTNNINNSLNKEGEDQSESHSTCASRGNWWQGSLYY
ncbi:uncharacterized protein LOC127244942 isoform X1 [Andrographis paniculata]|uniref:uncharacterized protein LOC127244942 isoform X1 n=1 Tax=Andrographis paniculata TaxID=175694 RepID=UPI0021E74240|nr:uncharacterized protein LOC127244942 isoform X1 [Andrographis paniculata]